jgi:molybdopterin molybdotransferase
MNASSRLLSPAEAEVAIRTHGPRLPEISLPLDSLQGAILREPIVASRDQPPFDRVTMDGIAFAISAFELGRRSFRIAGVQAAGAAPLVLSDSDGCLEVMTGASLPQGCDCVIPVEKIVVRDGIAHLADEAAPARGLNIHARGIDVHEGEPLLEPGARLGPAEVAVIAANGLTHARVARAPDIIVISTGDELIEPGRPLADWQIYRSNVYAVVAALQRRGFRTLTHDHLPDHLPTLRTRLRAQLDAHDVLILSGGVSMGRFDYVPQVLGELGVSVVFHKVSQRPGKPMWFGVGAGGKTVYALPGNPVSTLVCLVRYVFPGLDAALGAPPAEAELVTLLEEFEVKPALTMFLPVKTSHEGERLEASPRPTRGSGDFTSLVGTDGFVELPAGPRVISKGARAPFYRW